VTPVFAFLRPSAEVPRHYEKQVLITNLLSLIFFTVTIGIFGIFYSLFGWISTLPVILLVAILFLGVPIVNKWVDHRIGRMALCLIPVWLTMFVTIYFKLHAGTDLTYIVYFDSRFILMAATILPGIVFRLEERPQLLICLGSTAVFLLFYDLIHQAFGAGYYQLGFTDPSYRYINYIVCVTFVTLLFGILLLRSVLERSETDLSIQNRDLIEKQNEIEAQHEELQQQQEEMTASSEQLETANSVILKQQGALEKYNHTLEGLVREKSFELVKTNEELVKYNNELLQFSYTVSHNLRGPVARMLGLTRLLNSAESIEDRGRLEEMILKSSEELDEILKDLSLIIDIRNDLYRVREKIFLEEEWNKAVNLLGESVKSVFYLDVDFSKTPYLYGIRPMIQSIFYNLFSNAIKYQSPSRKLRVKISSGTLEDNRKTIEISDNGLGMDLKSQGNHLFKLYKRFHPHVSGKGLGLYLVKTQVEALNGTISVESEPDKGTRFQIVFTEPEEVTRQIFYDNEAVQLYYHGNLNIIVIYWKREVTSHEYHEAFEALVNSLNTYQAPGWISDVRRQGIISEKDQIWFGENILPELLKGGFKYVAVIGLDSRERQRYHDYLFSLSSELRFDLRNFSSMDESMTWMESALRDHEKTVKAGL
jgi:signal transduction histidine kinase